MDGPRVPRLSLDLLRSFRAAARHLSFTRAAEELCLTQPAISRSVKTLEEQLGTPLFRRVNRALELTQAGEALYRAVDEALATIDQATRRVVDRSRSLSVTTTVALASTWLVPRLPRFTQAHPHIDMRLLASNEQLDLRREHIDVAIRYVPREWPAPPLERLFGYRQFPVCSPTISADVRRPLRSPADLRHQVLLDFETTLFGRPWSDWRTWFATMHLPGIEAAGSLRFSHYDQVIAAAAAGSGVAVGKWPHLGQHLRDGALAAPLGDAGVARPGDFFVEVSDAAPRSAAEAFVGWLRDEARQESAAHTPGAGAE